jgi:hypothetical protein
VGAKPIAHKTPNTIPIQQDGDPLPEWIKDPLVRSNAFRKGVSAREQIGLPEEQHPEVSISVMAVPLPESYFLIGDVRVEKSVNSSQNHIHSGAPGDNSMVAINQSLNKFVDYFDVVVGEALHRLSRWTPMGTQLNVRTT